MQGSFLWWTKGTKVSSTETSFCEEIHQLIQMFLSKKRNAAQKCPPLAMAIALDIRKGIPHDNSTFIEFPVVEIASAIGWNSGVVKYQLKQLEWTTGTFFG